MLEGAGSTDHDSYATQLIIATGTADGIRLSGVRGGGIRNMQLRGEGLTGGAMIVTERRGGTGNYMLTYMNVRFKNGFNGITLRACNTIRFQNCVWSGFNGEQVILLNGEANTSRADPVEFVQCGIAAGSDSPNTDNLVIDGLGGSIKLIATAVLFGRHGIWLRNRTGESGPKFLYFEGGGFENAHGVPVLLESGTHAQFSNTYISSDSEQDNIRIDPTFTGIVTINSCVIRGCGRNGIDIGSSRVTVTGCLIGNNGRTAHPAFARTIAAVSAGLSGQIRMTTAGEHGWEDGDRITVQEVGGAVEANGKWRIAVVAPNQFDLLQSSYTNAYTGGGTAWRNGAGIHIRPSATRVVVTGNAVGSLPDGVSRQDYGIVCEASDVLVSDNDLNGNQAGPVLLLAQPSAGTLLSGNKGMPPGIDGWLSVSLPGTVADGLYDLGELLYADGQRLLIVKSVRKLAAGSCQIRFDADGGDAGGGGLATSASLVSEAIAAPYTVDGTTAPKRLQLRVSGASGAAGLEVQFGYRRLEG